MNDTVQTLIAFLTVVNCILFCVPFDRDLSTKTRTLQSKDYHI